MSEIISSESARRKDGSWTLEQHQRFVDGLLQFGKNWNKILLCVPSRNSTQIRSHAQKFFNKLEGQFESRAILGRESDEIMGPPSNEKQYQIYLKIVKPRISKKVKPKQIETLQLSEKFLKNKTQNEANNYFSPNYSFLPQDPEFSHINTINPTNTAIKTSTNQSFFTEFLLQNRTLSELPLNFYNSYVDMNNTHPFNNLNLRDFSSYKVMHQNFLNQWQIFQQAHKKVY